MPSLGLGGRNETAPVTDGHGRLLVTFADVDLSGVQHIVLRRYTSRGRIDKSFGNDGTVTVADVTPSGLLLVVSDLAISSQGIIGVAVMRDASPSIAGRVYELDSRGQAVAGFGPDGSSPTAMAPETIAFNAEGRVVFGGARARTLHIGRLILGGAPDPSFGSGGLVASGLPTKAPTIWNTDLVVFAGGAAAVGTAIPARCSSRGPRTLCRSRVIVSKVDAAGLPETGYGSGGRANLVSASRSLGELRPLRFSMTRNGSRIALSARGLARDRVVLITARGKRQSAR